MRVPPGALTQGGNTCGSDETGARGVEEVEGLLDFLDLVGGDSAAFVVLRPEGRAADAGVALND